jgi:hypothetical protein
MGTEVYAKNKLQFSKPFLLLFHFDGVQETQSYPFLRSRSVQACTTTFVA